MKLFSKRDKAAKGVKVPNGRKAFEAMPLADRVITFYAEDGDSWPHLAPIVDALVDEFGWSVCYLTSSEHDPIFTAGRPGVRPFFIGEGVKRAFLFQTMEVGVLVATVPQLGISVLPKSRFAATLGTQYVYVFHSMASTHMIYEPDGFDHYDTVLCVAPTWWTRSEREKLTPVCPRKSWSSMVTAASTRSSPMPRTPAGKLRRWGRSRPCWWLRRGDQPASSRPSGWRSCARSSTADVGSSLGRIR